MEVLRTAILDWVWRKKGKAFSPLEVVQQMFPQSWESFVPEILEEMRQMHQEGKIQVFLDGRAVEKEFQPSGKEEILPVSKPAGKKKG